MNKVERLAELFGNRTLLAAAIDRSPAIITRMIKAGRVDPKYNAALRTEIATWMGGKNARAALDCLEPDTCPTCGQPVPHGSVL